VYVSEGGLFTDGSNKYSINVYCGKNFIFSHFLLKDDCYFIIVYTLVLDSLYYLLFLVKLFVIKL